MKEKFEDRRYCGNCGKIFSIFDCKMDKVNRVASPCCENIFNNEIICKHDANGDCSLGENNNQNCGSECKEYKTEVAK